MISCKIHNPPTHLDHPVIVHDQIRALEVSVADGRRVAVQIQHASRRLQRAGQHQLVRPDLSGQAVLAVKC